MPWILNEDEALKKKFQGLTVTDTNAPTGRPVAVRFRLPETEFADMTFPAVIIEHSGLSKADEREHRGLTQLQYAPEGLANWWADDPARQLDPTLSPYVIEFPIPYNLDYQVTVYARKMQHLISLVGKLAQPTVLPARFGFLEIPQDGTTRSLEVIGESGIESDKDGDGKRIFRSIYSVRVTSELIPEQVTAVEKAITVDLSLVLMSDPISA